MLPVLHTNALLITASFNTLRPIQNGRHFPDAIWNAFSWMKLFDFWLSKFHRMLFLIDNKSALVQIMAWCWNKRQAIIWTYEGLFYWHIYASLGLNELTSKIENGGVNGSSIRWIYVQYFLTTLFYLHLTILDRVSILETYTYVYICFRVHIMQCS